MKKAIKELGLDLALAPLIIGALLLLSVLFIKFAGPSEFMGIDNPPSTYGIYFKTGLIAGILISLIGLVTVDMTYEKRMEEDTEEEEKEEETEEFEDLESLVEEEDAEEEAEGPEEETEEEDQE